LSKNKLRQLRQRVLFSLYVHSNKCDILPIVRCWAIPIMSAAVRRWCRTTVVPKDR